MFFGMPFADTVHKLVSTKKEPADMNELMRVRGGEIFERFVCSYCT